MLSSIIVSDNHLLSFISGTLLEGERTSGAYHGETERFLLLGSILGL